MPVCFSELGIHPTEEQMQEMAHRCSLATGGRIGSAMPLKEADMLAVYHLANH
jgi:hypothetical protein